MTLNDQFIIWDVPTTDNEEERQSVSVCVFLIALVLLKWQELKHSWLQEFLENQNNVK